MINQALASILGIQTLVVGSAVYDSAAEGQTFVSGDIWPDDYALVFRRQTGPTKVNPGLGRIVEWSGESGQLQNGLDNVVEYREEGTESHIYRVRDYSEEKIFDPFFGHLLQVDA
jgi:hypothetical protein